mgnify:CR=1 FL=1
MEESEMFRANRILEKNQKKEEKLEQLRKIFVNKIDKYFITLGYYSQKRNFTANDLAKDLIHEVKNLISNK